MIKFSEEAKKVFITELNYIGNDVTRRAVSAGLILVTA